MNKKIFGIATIILLVLPVLAVVADDKEEEIDNHAPDAPIILSGVQTGAAKKEYSYIVTAFDQDGDDVYYNIDWNGCVNEGVGVLDFKDEDPIWYGPYRSGEEVDFDHTWSKDGEYMITIRAKDTHNLVSKDTNYQVSISKNKIVDMPFFLRLFERFPNLVRLLNQILEL